MPRAGLAPAAVIEAGAALADEVGLDNLTMGLLAERVGVRTPSLYKHVDSLDALRRGIGMRAKAEFAVALARAAVGQSGAAAVHAFADAYRAWTLEHPGRYAATVRAPEPGDEEDRQVSDESIQILFDVLTGLGLPESRAIDAARALRSSLHGFASLEAGGAFGLDRDVTESYHFMVDALIAGFTAP